MFLIKPIFGIIQMFDVVRIVAAIISIIVIAILWWVMEIKLKLKAKDNILIDVDNPRILVELIYESFINNDHWIIQLSIRNGMYHKSHIFPIGSIEIRDVIGLKIDIKSIVKLMKPTIDLKLNRDCFLLD